MANLFELPRALWVDGNGNPGAGWKLNFYIAGTSTRLDTYSVSALTAGFENANPVVANASGYWGPIYLQAKSYKVVLTDANDVEIWSQDNVHGTPSVTGTSNMLYVATIAAMTALVKSQLTDGQQVHVGGYTAIGDGGGGMFRWHDGSSTTADTGTVFASDEAGTGRWKRIYDGPLNLLWFGALNTGAGDQATAIQACINACPSAGGEIYAPAGIYKFGTTLTITKKITIRGAGYSENSGNGSATEFKKASTLDGAGIKITSHAVHLTNFAVEGEAGNGGDGIEISGEANSCAVEYVSVHNQGRHGLNIGNGAGTGHQNLCRLDHIVAHGNGDDEDGDGIHIDYGNASSNANTGVCTNFHCNANSRDGVYVNAAGGWTFAGGSSEANGRHGFYLGPDSSKNTLWGGVLNEANTDQDLYVDTGAEQNWIVGNALLAANTTDNGTETYIQTVDTPGTKVTSVIFNSVATGTTVIPQDDTIPQSTEGDEYMTLAVTRKTGDGSKFHINVTIHLATSAAGNNMIAALFKGADAGALAVGTMKATAANDVVCINFKHSMSAPSGTTTFKVRAGGNGAGTTTFNGSAGARLFGGVIASSIVVTEGT